MPQGEASRRKSLIVRRAHSIIVGCGRVGVSGQRRNERMEYLRRKRHEWWSRGVSGRECYLEMKNRWGIRAFTVQCLVVSLTAVRQQPLKRDGTVKNTFSNEQDARPVRGISWCHGHVDAVRTGIFQAGAVTKNCEHVKAGLQS